MKFIGLLRKNIIGPAPKEQPNVEFVNLARISLVRIEKMNLPDAPSDVFWLKLMADQGKEIWHGEYETYKEAYEMALKIIGEKTSIIGEDQYF